MNRLINVVLKMVDDSIGSIFFSIQFAAVALAAWDQWLSLDVKSER